MAEPVDTAFVKIWGMTAGAVAWDDAASVATFEYDPEFVKKGLELAPLIMPLSRASEYFSFRRLNSDTFRGLPGLLADSLPDAFGNEIIDAWLARQGRSPENFNPVERLCYTGKRGMGALEFHPSFTRQQQTSVPVEIDELIRLANLALDRQSEFKTSMRDNGSRSADSLIDLLRVGTSAGGARAKAVIALHPKTLEIRSGQVSAPTEYEYWIIKFDGVANARQSDPAGYGKIEFVYHQMAIKAGIKMMECRLLEESGRAHFMTRRFDRGPHGTKEHLQSLCAIAHYDYNDPHSYSYEQAFQVMRKLHLGHEDIEQLFLRMVFNVIARNQDDHTKNIAFLMDREGVWRLSPVFDMTYSYNPGGDWTNIHQMSINGKRAGHTLTDLKAVGELNNIQNVEFVVDRVVEAVSEWPRLAREAGVPGPETAKIQRAHLLSW